jgi:DNA-binding transcriptional LysR family regulator
MDLRRLRAFVAVADHGTISKAAGVLNVTQPALSRQLASLEYELGFKLFERAGRALALTPRAEQLLGECRGLLTHASALDERAQALRRGDMKVLKIAASAMTIEGTFPSFLRPFAERFPGVRLALIEADAADHLAMLERGEAHLAINVINAVEVDDNRFGHHLLRRFHMIAACAASFNLGGGDTIEIRKLVDYPLLVLDTSYATRHLFDAACRLAGVRPDLFLESISSHTLLALAEAGHGVAVVPSILRPNENTMRVLRVTHRGDLLRIAPAVIWDKRRTLPRFAHGFSEALAEHLRAAFPSTPPARATGKLARKGAPSPARTAGRAAAGRRLPPTSSPRGSRRARARGR